MTEIKESENLEKKEGKQTELGKVAERIATDPKEVGKMQDPSEQLSDEELNEPIDEIVMPEMKSLDCRSECKYNTGDRSKYSNYGFSD